MVSVSAKKSKKKFHACVPLRSHIKGSHSLVNRRSLLLISKLYPLRKTYRSITFSAQSSSLNKTFNDLALTCMLMALFWPIIDLSLCLLRQQFDLMKTSLWPAEEWWPLDDLFWPLYYRKWESEFAELCNTWSHTTSKPTSQKWSRQVYCLAF